MLLGSISRSNAILVDAHRLTLLRYAVVNDPVNRKSILNFSDIINLYLFEKKFITCNLIPASFNLTGRILSICKIRCILSTNLHHNYELCEKISDKVILVHFAHGVMNITKKESFRDLTFQENDIPFVCWMDECIEYLVDNLRFRRPVYNFGWPTEIAFSNQNLNLKNNQILFILTRVKGMGRDYVRMNINVLRLAKKLEKQGYSIIVRPNPADIKFIKRLWCLGFVLSCEDEQSCLKKYNYVVSSGSTMLISFLKVGAKSIQLNSYIDRVFAQCIISKPKIEDLIKALQDENEYQPINNFDYIRFKEFFKIDNN